MGQFGDPLGVGNAFYLHTGTSLAAYIYVLAPGTNPCPHLAGAPVQEANIITGFHYLIRVHTIGISYSFDQRHPKTIGLIGTNVTDIRDLTA